MCQWCKYTFSLGTLENEALSKIGLNFSFSTRFVFVTLFLSGVRNLLLQQLTYLHILHHELLGLEFLTYFTCITVKSGAATFPTLIWRCKAQNSSKRTRILYKVLTFLPFPWIPATSFVLGSQKRRNSSGLFSFSQLARW